MFCLLRWCAWSARPTSELKVFGWLDSKVNKNRGGPGQPDQHTWHIRTLGKPARSGRVQLVITATDQVSAMVLFSELHTWHTWVPFTIDGRGWRMMPVRWLQPAWSKGYGKGQQQGQPGQQQGQPGQSASSSSSSGLQGQPGPALQPGQHALQYAPGKGTDGKGKDGKGKDL